MDNIFSFEAKDIQGNPVSLKDYQGKVLLIVNVASKCGFTSQYKGLQSLYEKYSTRGFAVLGFPCNQFGGQEPGDENEIKSFCELNYNVSFPLFTKIEVNGENTHPLYKFMKSQAPGVMGSEAIKWNFTKFLISKKGEVLERFAPTTSPENIAPKIEKALE